MKALSCGQILGPICNCLTHIKQKYRARLFFYPVPLLEVAQQISQVIVIILFPGVQRQNGPEKIEILLGDLITIFETIEEYCLLPFNVGIAPEGLRHDFS